MMINVHGIFQAEGKDEEELTKAIAYCEEIRERHKGSVQSQVSPSKEARQSVQIVSTANADKWCNVTGNQRFRITKEEREEFGDGPNSREEAAKGRLIELGEDTVENPNSAGTATEAKAPMETVSIDDDDFT